ncbi:MAG: GntR family transcriptional regulator [Thermoleophilaceae bacterium]|jgi:DNA-binding GntR family transcriptional regulator|nr:GntR family transcriptional regulator [Thermoleophilaceae bacterium]
MSPRPIAYRALAAELRDALQQGKYRQGEQIPTEAELSESFGVSRQTVRRALQDLVAEGLVFRVPGRGSFAALPARSGQYLRSVGSVDDLLAMSLDTVLEVMEPLTEQIDVDAAGRLGLASDEVMHAVIRRLHRDLPFAVTQLWLPPQIGRRAAESGALAKRGERTRETVISMIDSLGEHHVAGAQQSITAVTVPPQFEEPLGLAPGAPALRADRLYLDTTDTPVELATSHFHPARYSYRLQLRRSIDDAR